MSANPGPEVVLVRHGQTEWSLSGRHTGVTDLALTAAGEDEARGLAPVLASYNFSSVLTSPLERAVSTAKLAGLADTKVEPDLIEWNYGAFEGRTTADISKEYPGWSIWDGPWIGGETIDDVTKRADDVIAKLRAEHQGAVVAVVAHGHILRVLGARWAGAEPTVGRRLALATASVSVLGWEHGLPVIVHWNVPSKGQLAQTKR